jgi:hypothetical protein
MVKAAKLLDAMADPRPYRLSESPEIIALGDDEYDYSSPCASAYSIINGKVVSTRRTHPFIFNALEVMANPTSGPVSGASARASLKRSGAEAFLKDYGITVWPSPLTHEDLRWFSGVFTREMGALRERTQSGRVWTRVPVASKIVAAMSFWARSDEVPDDTVRLVIDRYSLTDRPVYVEFIDSVRPAIYTPVERETRKLKSKIDPELSEEEIMEILVRAHTCPESLTAKEKAVLREFRGSNSVHAAVTGVTPSTQ